MRKRRKKSLGRTLIGMVFITIGIIACTVSAIAGIDAYCASDINKWLPIYPEAELIDSAEEGFFRPRAMGITQQLYYTGDDVVDVRGWYREYRRDITQGSYNARNANTASSGVATTDYSIFEDTDNGGTLIRTYSECAYN
ncbi:MAG: hypothetical protein AAF846_06795 [Chloroflexota bacterium]